MTMMLSCRLFLLLLLLCTVYSIAVDTEETCTANGEEGSCDLPNASKNEKGESNSNKQNDNNCMDENQKCAWWASQGECDANPNYMLRNCQKSCQVCFTGKTAEQLIKERQKKLEEEKE